MKFSIIVPVYNGERFLGECLSSIESQTCRDFEVIVVDDGSSDNTPAMLDAFSEKMGNAIVLHGPNRGLLLARRKGLIYAKGEYVVFLDSDDALRSDALEVMSQAIDETGADIVSFGISRKADYSVAEQSISFNPGFYGGERYGLVKEHVCRGRFNNLCGKATRLCRIDVDATYGAYKGLMHGEDLFQLLPIADACNSLVHLSDILYYYRPNGESSTARYKASQLEDIVCVNYRLREYAEKWGGRCPALAEQGEANQYFYLVKMSELSNCGDEEKLANFESIRKAMAEENVFERMRDAKLRLDNRMLAFCLEHDMYGFARTVVRLVEVMKR